jgi:hypothetical protein
MLSLSCQKAAIARGYCRNGERHHRRKLRIDFRSCLRPDFSPIFRDGRSDEPVTTARQGLNPTLAAGHLAERATQRGYLHRQIAVLDREARPRRLHQCVL